MQCPTCKKAVEETGDARPRWFPFCCERCKLIDLGRWLDGKYQIAVEEDDQDETSLDSPHSSDDNSARREP
jgi:endogenous inhibitor of DNA gyrase (YacG/DUF329 family)